MANHSYILSLMVYIQLSKILEFRHDESMRIQTSALAQLSSDQKVATEHVEQLQIQTARDSRLLKSLTALATLYLPASLIAVCGYLRSLIRTNVYLDCLRF